MLGLEHLTAECQGETGAICNQSHLYPVWQGKEWTRLLLLTKCEPNVTRSSVLLNGGLISNESLMGATLAVLVALNCMFTSHSASPSFLKSYLNCEALQSSLPVIFNQVVGGNFCYAPSLLPCLSIGAPSVTSFSHQARSDKELQRMGKRQLGETNAIDVWFIRSLLLTGMSDCKGSVKQKSAE